MTDALKTLFPPQHQLRAELEAMVIRDLLGPAQGPDEELIERSVRERYLVGILAPSRKGSDARSTVPGSRTTVPAAYGWTDLELDHGFHETRQGIRFTISEPARREVLQRLLKLNHERYAEEVKQGLHGTKGGAGRVTGGGKSAGGGGKKTGGGAKGAAKKSDATGSKNSRGLFDEEGDA